MDEATPSANAPSPSSAGVGLRFPAVVVHGLADVRTVLAPGLPVTLLSAPGAALYAGCGWWRALATRAREDYPLVPLDDVLDCADASGQALAGLRIGQHIIVLAPDAPGWSAIAAIAARAGGTVLTTRPPALDLARPGTTLRLTTWLRGG